MAISAEEQNFNDRVENAPIVKEIIADLNGLKKGQVKLGEDMVSLKLEVSEGFKEIKRELKADIGEISRAVDTLTGEVKANKEKALIDSNESLKDQLTKAKDGSDKIKNRVIGSGAVTIIGLILEKLGLISLG